MQHPKEERKEKEEKEAVKICKEEQEGEIFGSRRSPITDTGHCSQGEEHRPLG
jgi:hypothetical protein